MAHRRAFYPNFLLLVSLKVFINQYKEEKKLKKVQAKKTLIQKVGRLLCPRDAIGQWLENFFVKGQMINILDFIGHTISMAAIHLCHCNVKAVIEDM